MNRRHALLALGLSLALCGPALAGPDTVYLETKNGRITIELRPDLAPRHVKQIKTLVNRGFYDGLKFHRVMSGFMAQTGDPKGNGTGGSDLPDIPAEFSPTAQFRRGTVGMARSGKPNSANSQFFICFADAPQLDGSYTIVGVVTDGLDVLDQIKKASPGAPNGMVEDPDRIVSMTMAEKGR